MPSSSQGGAASWMPRASTPAQRLTPRERELWRLDGLVGEDYGMLDGAATPDIRLTPGDRLALVASAVPARGILVLATAAWIHTGRAVSTVFDVAFPTPVRDRFGPIRPHCVRYAERDVLTAAGCRVTTPEQTAADLARTLPRAALEDPRCDQLRALRALLDGGVSTRAAIAVVDRQPRRAYARRAREVLRSLEGA